MQTAEDITRPNNKGPKNHPLDSKLAVLLGDPRVFGDKQLDYLVDFVSVIAQPLYFFLKLRNKTKTNASFNPNVSGTYVHGMQRRRKWMMTFLAKGKLDKSS